MNTLLIVTAGRTDVYLVTKQDGEEFRQEFDKNHCAQMHIQLQTNNNWDVVDAPPKKSENSAKAIPHGPKILLATPKLDAALTFCQTERHQVTNALILNTRREGAPERGEPRYAAEILKRRIEQKLPEARVEIGIFLTWGRLEGSDSRDAILRRDVVEKLDRFVREAIDHSNPELIVVSATGGVDKVSRLIEEMARLYVQDPKRVIALETPERDGGDTALPKQIGPDPLQSYRLRRRALDVLNSGDLLGPWAVVKHLEEESDSKSNYPWLAVLEGVYLFAASLPLGETRRKRFAFLNQRVAVRAALRTEFALRREDIPTATLATVAFGEAALRQLLERQYFEKRMLFGRPVYTFRDNLADAQRASIQHMVGRNRNIDLPFTQSEDDCFEITPSRKHELTIARALFPESALVAYLDVTSSPRILRLRNDVAHGEPTINLMDTVWKEMRESNLWQDADPHFLGTTLVNGLLKQLGVWEPNESARSFLHEVRRHVLGQTQPAAAGVP